MLKILKQSDFAFQHVKTMSLSKYNCFWQTTNLIFNAILSELIIDAHPPVTAHIPLWEEQTAHSKA